MHRSQKGDRIVLPRTKKSFAHATRFKAYADGFFCEAYGIMISPAHSLLAGGVVRLVGVALVGHELGHTNPRSLVQNLHGTARLVWQERGSRIGTCHTPC